MISISHAIEQKIQLNISAHAPLKRELV